MRQSRDHQFQRKTPIPKRNESPNSVGFNDRDTIQYRTMDESTNSFVKQGRADLKNANSNNKSLIDRFGSGATIDYPLRQNLNGINITQQAR